MEAGDPAHGAARSPGKRISPGNAAVKLQLALLPLWPQLRCRRGRSRVALKTSAVVNPAWGSDAGERPCPLVSPSPPGSCLWTHPTGRRGHLRSPSSSASFCKRGNRGPESRMMGLKSYRGQGRSWRQSPAPWPQPHGPG